MTINVLCVNNLKYNLLSARTLELQGFEIKFSNRTGLIYRNGKLIAKSDKGESLYTLTFQIIKEVAGEMEIGYLTKTTRKESDTLWHRKMGHTSSIKPMNDCKTCIQAMMSKFPHKETRLRVVEPLENYRTTRRCVRTNISRRN